MKDMIKPYGNEVQNIVPSVEDRRDATIGNQHSSDVPLVPGVCNPVGSPLNTDHPGINSRGIAPLPMRPIPS